jgi:hypothetical protein
VNDELEMMWKDVVLSRNLIGGTEENEGKSQVIFANLRVEIRTRELSNMKQEWWSLDREVRWIGREKPTPNNLCSN